MKSHHCALIVEDDAETAFDLGQILKSLDCESVPVTNAEVAMREPMLVALYVIETDNLTSDMTPSEARMSPELK